MRPIELLSQLKTFPEKLGEVQIDQAKSMTDAERKLFFDILRKYEDVLGEDLPGYNDYFDVVKASIKFASRARPVPHKTRLPSYGEHGQRLFNMKALSMVKKRIVGRSVQIGNSTNTYK